jgi:hypothetical protein
LTAAGPARVAEGTWGGTGIALTVTAEGARFELDCAHGTIDAPLSLDGDGRFEVAGTFIQERPGPVREGAAETREAVRCAGRLDGENLSIQIVRTGSPRPMTPMTAVLGRAPRLRKCG